MKNLSQMVIELINAGFTESAIAEKVGCAQPTIHRLKTGSESKYSTGKAIERLHSDVIRNDKSERVA